MSWNGIKSRQRAEETVNMATTKEFYEYAMEQLSRIGDITSRKMMGEYCVYYRGRMIGDICDNQFLLKPVPSVLKAFPEAQRSYPYEGSKTLMVLVDSLENTEVLKEVLAAMYEELPEKKRK